MRISDWSSDGCSSDLILAALLVREGTCVAIEDPGYPDVRNIFGLKTDRVLPVPVDAHGLPVNQQLDGADLVFVTPSRSAERRVGKEGVRTCRSPCTPHPENNNQYSDYPSTHTL